MWNARKKWLVYLFVCFLFQGKNYAQQFDSVVGGVVPSNTLGGVFVASGLNIQQILDGYNLNGVTYNDTNTAFQAQMNQIFSTISTDTTGLLADTKASLDTILSSDFGEFVSAFSTYYGEAILLSTHLSYPVGYDQIDKFPSIVVGFGGGTAFANVQGIQSSLTGDSASMFSNLQILPTLGISLNGGIGLSERWSLRFSIFPNTNISLPTSVTQLENFNISFNYGSYRARVSYVLLEDKKLGPGMSLSGFVGYTNGSLTVQTVKQTLSPITDTYTTPIDFTVTATPSYSAEAICTWSDFTIGPEIRLWLNLNFIIPYIGYGLGFQYSQMNTTFNLNTDVLLEESSYAAIGGGSTGVASNALVATNTETISTTSTISDQSLGSYYQNRIILGVEIKIVMVRLNAEVVFDPIASITGLSFGFNTAF